MEEWNDEVEELNDEVDDYLHWKQSVKPKDSKMLSPTCGNNESQTDEVDDHLH